MNAYKENTEELNSIETHQTVILDELSTIEEELDRMIPQAGGNLDYVSIGDNLKKNKYLAEFLRDPNLYKTPASREKVFGQALDLEKDIYELQKELADVNKSMTNTDKNHTKASDLYLYKKDDKID